jgi:hypothetical protein
VSFPHKPYSNLTRACKLSREITKKEIPVDRDLRKDAREAFDVLDEWSTPTDISKLLKVPVPTLYGWRYKGSGPPAIRIGRHLRYHRPDVLRWLEMQERVG